MVLDMAIPQIAAYQRAHMKRIEAKRRAIDRAQRNAGRDVGNIRTSLEAYAARRAAEQAAEDDS